MITTIFGRLFNTRARKRDEIDIAAGDISEIDKPSSARIGPGAGKFSISHEMLRDNFDAVQIVLSKVVPIRAESVFCDSCIEYTGLSYSFRALAHGERVPTYKVHVRKDNNARLNRAAYSVEFVETCDK